MTTDLNYSMVWKVSYAQLHTGQVGKGYENRGRAIQGGSGPAEAKLMTFIYLKRPCNPSGGRT